MLLVVDIQRDFCAGGALAAHDSATLIGTVNSLIARAVERRSLVVFTRDWHPRDHSSFAKNGGRWPTHCVAGTPGALFHPDLFVPDDAIVVSKGVLPAGNGFSPFEEQRFAELVGSSPSMLLVTGIALEYCVKETCLDARKLDIPTVVAKDAVRAVSPDAATTEKVWRELARAGCRISDSGELDSLI